MVFLKLNTQSVCAWGLDIWISSKVQGYIDSHICAVDWTNLLQYNRQQYLLSQKPLTIVTFTIISIAYDQILGGALVTQ